MIQTGWAVIPLALLGIALALTILASRRVQRRLDQIERDLMRRPR